jgi:hypothetical protein
MLDESFVIWFEDVFIEFEGGNDEAMAIWFH